MYSNTYNSKQFGTRILQTVLTSDDYKSDPFFWGGLQRSTSTSFYLYQALEISRNYQWTYTCQWYWDYFK